MKAISRILVPVDFSACSMAAVDCALTMGAQFHARLHVLHCYQVAVHNSQDIGFWGVSTAHDVKTHRDEVRELDSFMRRTGCDELGGVTGEAACAGPFETIIERSSEYDLIVMGTHGRTGVARMMLGSIAEKVVRDAACPVLAVHESKEIVATESSSRPLMGQPVEATGT